MNINNYSDYILDLILENFKSDQIILLLSTDLKLLIKSIKHPISDKILSVNSNNYYKSKITLLDIDDSDENKKDNISFTLSNKAIEKICTENGLNIDLKQQISENDINSITNVLRFYRDKTTGFNRSTTSLGKIVNKLFPGEYKSSGDPGNDIESFVNKYKSIRNNINNFELVNGDDIVYWYNQENYLDLEQGPLHSSCMRYNRCEQYIKFYSVNKEKVSLLILKDLNDDSKIIGRALVWNLDTPSGRTFMDRIYTIHDYDVELFKKYATKRNWLYKKNQNMEENEYIVDTKYNDDYKKMDLIVEDIIDSEYEQYPYMDTLKYYDGNKLSNDRDEIDSDNGKKLTDTGGGSESLGYWSDYYGEYIDIEDGDYAFCELEDEYRHFDDCFYSDNYGIYISFDYARENMTECYYSDEDNSIGDEYRKEGDYVTLSNGRTSTKEYAQENFYYSDYSDEWVRDGDYSEYHGTHIDSDNSVLVYIDAQKDNTDYRAEDDETWWKWDYDDEKYDNEVSERELKEEHDLIKKRNSLKHLRKRRIKNNIKTND